MSPILAWVGKNKEASVEKRERKQRQATYCSDGLKAPQQFTDATRTSVSMKNASKLQVTAKMAKQQTSHQFGEQKICRPFARVCVHGMAPAGNKIQSKALLPGIPAFHTGRDWEQAALASQVESE